MIDKGLGLAPLIDFRKPPPDSTEEDEQLKDEEAQREMEKEEERRVDLEMTFSEYMKQMETWSDKELKEEAIIDAWKVFDKDGRGSIRTPEVRQYMTTIGAKLDDDEVEALIELFDPEETGQVDYEEKIKKAFKLANEGKAKKKK